MDTIKNYTIQESPRAKHVRVKMSVREGLIVVVPKGFDHDRVPALLERKGHWLEKASKKIEEQRKFFEPEPPGKVPERITLRAIGEEWSVDYRATEAPWVAAVERPGNRLLVYGDIDNIQACKDALKRWLNRKTHKHLVPWLERLAEENDFRMNRTFVKSQKTRWASCSRHKAVSINLKTLFIPQELVRYIYIHELCHTIYLNHSSQFWALVRKHTPDFEISDKKLREAWRYVPIWVNKNRILNSDIKG